MDLEVLTEADNGEVMIFQGESKARSDWAQFLEDHPQVCAKLAKACRKAWVLRHGVSCRPVSFMVAWQD